MLNMWNHLMAAPQSQHVTIFPLKEKKKKKTSPHKWKRPQLLLQHQSDAKDEAIATKGQ
jgi:hypothetical protein